jgi:AcrR family transcriptional regulator
MADVAEQAGVSKGTPYLYFESKQALFIVLHEQWDCGLADRVNAEVAALPEAGRRSPRRVLRAARPPRSPATFWRRLRRTGC